MVSCKDYSLKYWTSKVEAQRKADENDENSKNKEKASAPRPPTTITLRNQKESPLLRLPAELRDKIYGYVFSGGRIIPHFSPIRNTFAIFQGFIRNQTIFGPVHGDNPLALLYVCRQTYAETALLPFQEFVFAVGGLGVDSFNLMMDAFTKQQRESIRHVALSSWGLPKILSEMAGYWNGTKGTTYGTYLVL